MPVLVSGRLRGEIDDMSRIEQADKERRAIERGQPQETALHLLRNEHKKQIYLQAQYESIGEHRADCDCYFCTPIV